MDFSRNFTGPIVTLRARNSAAPILVVGEKEDVYFQMLGAVAGALASVEAVFIRQGV